jgi:thiamine biosynthesis lipoprotein
VIRDPRRETREVERRLDLFGTSVHILVGGPAPEGEPSPELAAAVAQAVLRSCQLELTRFEPDSELSRLNADPRPAHVASKLVAGAVAAAVGAAERSDGLVDPTLLGAMEDVGYAGSRAGVEPASLGDALQVAPARRQAAPAREPAWRLIAIIGREVRRPPGLLLDLGGTAKGFAADRAAAALRNQLTFAVDAGGDIVMGGTGGVPRTVTIAHPLEGGRAIQFELAAGAVATSGLGTRIWRTDTGFAHHLLDPSTGQPAWTGVIQATALAANGLDAETLAKTALLSGPEQALQLLERTGGALVLDDGRIVLAGPLREHAREAA